MTIFTPIYDMKLKPCGPSAISILTGVPVSRIEKMIRRGRRGGYRNRNGRKITIRGTYNWEVQRVLKRLGCKVTAFKFASGSLSKFADDTRHAGTFLVNVTGHYVVCSGGLITDNGWPPLPIEHFPKTMRRVLRAWRVEAPAVPRYTKDDPIERPRKEKPPRDLIAERHARILGRIKLWETKKKRAETALKRLRRQRAYYERARANRCEVGTPV